MTYNLYDEKGSCQLCSTSTVQRRVDKSEYAGHAKRHIEAGDPVKRYYEAGIYKASDRPTIFKIEVKE